MHNYFCDMVDGIILCGMHKDLDRCRIVMKMFMNLKSFVNLRTSDYVPKNLNQNHGICYSLFLADSHYSPFLNISVMQAEKQNSIELI